MDTMLPSAPLARPPTRLRRTRAGGVRRVATEHYLRTDLPCGAAACKVCSLPDASPGVARGRVRGTFWGPGPEGGTGSASGGGGGGGGRRAAKPRTVVYVPSAAVVLRQIDLLECGLPPLSSVLFLQTVLKAVRASSAAVYARVTTLLTEAAGTPLGAASDVDDNGAPPAAYALFSNEHVAGAYVEREMGEADDAHDGRLVNAAIEYLATHWKPLHVEPLLLVEASEAGAEGDGSIAALVRRWSGAHPHLTELLAADEEADGGDGGGGGGPVTSGRRPPQLFADHLSEKAVRAGVRAGRLHVGTYRVSEYDVREGTVAVDLSGLGSRGKGDRTEVLIRGRAAGNRAVDGDSVVVELLPRSEWGVRSSRAVEDVGAGTGVGAEGEVDTLGDGVGRNGEGGADSGAAASAVAASPTGSGRAAKRKAAPCAAASAATVPLPAAASTPSAAAATATMGPPAVPKAEAATVMPCAKVVAIARRNWRPYCGSLASTTSAADGDRGLFIPVNRKLPRVRIRSRRLMELAGQRLLLIMDAWPRTASLPSGHIVRELGTAGGLEAETATILLEQEINTAPFSSAALATLPSADWVVTPDHLRGRWDLRDVAIASVDPPGCTDIDDALHYREIGGGKVEVGVHIADVTAFISPGCALDVEAGVRGTTVYLVDRRIEMLPGVLSGKLCSLMGNVDRLAFSALLTLDAATGRVIDAVFGRSVIHSKASLTYEAAQNRIDAARARGAPADAVDGSLLGLAAMAAKLRAARIAAGALTLASPEMRFRLERETNEVTDVTTAEHRETNAMVEEFMLAANVAVAARIHATFPHVALLRRHPRPAGEMFAPLLRAAAAAGHSLDVSSSKKLSDSLDAVAAASAESDPYLSTLLRIVATRCMSQAVYFSAGSVDSAEYLHYGLASPVYTHFTSPIRRYADVIVHRLLAACIGLAPLPDALASSARMQRAAEAINDRHRAAQFAGRASGALHTKLLIKRKAVADEAGRVLRVMENGVAVLVPRYGIEGVCYLSREDVEREAGDAGPAPTEWVDSYDEVRDVLTLNSGRSLRVLDTVRVGVVVKEVADRADRVVFSLLPRRQ